MESFEIMFYCNKKIYKKDIFSYIESNYSSFNHFGNDFIVDFFSEESKDYVEIRVSIFDFILTEKNYYLKLSFMLQYITLILTQKKEVSFATGIYELTYYLISKVLSINEFNEKILRKFPLVYIRNDDTIILNNVFIRNEYVTCYYNENAQNLF